MVKNRHSINFLLIGLIVLLGTSCSLYSDAELNIVEDTRVITSGNNFNYPIKEEVRKIISSKEEFLNEWDRLNPFGENVDEAPGIDFESRTVVLIMIETVYRGGHGIEKVEVYNSNDKWIISITEFEPGKSCFVTLNANKPYKLLSLPKLEKPIRYKTKTVARKCS